MQAIKMLAEIETRERTGLRIHSAVGLSVLAIYGGLMVFALSVMSSVNPPDQYGINSVHAAANDATNSITLTWTSTGDDGAVGQAASYDIRYSTSTLNESSWALATTVTGEPTPKVAGQAESMFITGLQPNTTYNFGLKVTDDAGNISALSNVATKKTDSLSIPTCVEDWRCEAWSTCTSSQQTRTCADQSNCGGTSNRPALTRTCAVNPDGTTSIPSGLSVDANDVAPNTVITAAPTDILITPRFTFTWQGLDDITAADQLQFSYQLDSRTWSGWSTTKLVTLRDIPNGQHTMSVRARDASGNIDPSPATTTFSVQLNTFLAVGVERGGQPKVRTYTTAGRYQKEFTAFETTFRGGIQVAVADLGDDGQSEIVVASNAGRRGEVRIFRGDGSRIITFLPYGTAYRDGVNLTVADVNGDGPMEIIVTKQKGTPNVRVFGYRNGRYTQVYREFNGESANYRNGVSLTAGDLNGDGRDEVLTAAAGSGAATLRIFRLQGTAMRQLAQRTNILGSARSGFSLTTADINGDGTDEIFVGPRANATPTVRVFVLRGSTIAQVRRDYRIFQTSERAGLRLSSADINSDGREDLVVSYGGAVQPRLMAYSGTNLAIRLRIINTFGTRDRLVLSHGSGT